jgi:ATP/maltotriose-dependent transcriptional regulator MalT
LNLPLRYALIAGYLKGDAWTEHARALHGIGRDAEALEAIAAAFEAYRHVPMSAWHVAVAEVVEAQILHDQGAHAEALDLLRPAAKMIWSFGSGEIYVWAKMSEAWMQWDAGNPTAEEALKRGDLVLLALLDMRIAAFRLRHGSPEEAALRFVVARDVFEAAGMRREVIRALWGLAEANVARGLFHEAISEYYKVQGMLLADGDVVDAAVASAEILELLLIAGRDDKVLPAADLLVGTFSDAGLPLNPMRAWTFIRKCARAGALTREDLAHVRAYFERLPLRPNAPFVAPEARP